MEEAISGSVSDLPHFISDDKRKRETNRPSFLALDETRYQKASRKVELIRPLIYLESRRKSDIDSVATKAGVNPRTIYRWLRKVKDFDGPAGLLTPKSFGGKGKGRINPMAESIFQELLDSQYMSLRKIQISVFYREYKATCIRRNVKPPSYWAVYRRVKSQDDRLVTQRRLGMESFRQKYHIGGGGFADGNFPLHTILIDHTKLDVILVDKFSGKEIGRPWLTIAIDAYSRCIWGYYLGFQAPTADIVGLTVRTGCLRKDDIVDMFNLKDWPIFGIPFEIHTDNGMDFRSKLLERGCTANGISLVRRPVKQPQYGSYVERFFGTLNTKLIHTLPGTTHSNIMKKGKYDSQKAAALTIDDLERLLLEFIAKQYHNEIHSGLGTSPLNKWREGLQSLAICPREPYNTERFRQDFLCFVEPDGKRVIERDGVHFKDFSYYAPELDLLLRYEDDKKKKYLIRYDPSDIRYLYLYDEDRDRYLTLALKSRPPNPITLYEVDRTKSELRKQDSRSINEDVIIDTILQRRDFIDEIQNKRTARRVAGERRTQDLKNRISVELAGQDVPNRTLNFDPESVDVDSVRIVRLKK